MCHACLERDLTNVKAFKAMFEPYINIMSSDIEFKIKLVTECHTICLIFLTVVYFGLTSVSLSAKDIYSPVFSPSNRKYNKVGEYNEKMAQSHIID